jgi:hypothetical protein
MSLCSSKNNDNNNNNKKNQKVNETVLQTWERARGQPPILIVYDTLI